MVCAVQFDVTLNKIVGSLPEDIGIMTSLSKVIRQSGTLAENFCSDLSPLSCVSLLIQLCQMTIAELEMANNALTGSLPSTLFRLTNLGKRNLILPGFLLTTAHHRYALSHTHDTTQRV